MIATQTSAVEQWLLIGVFFLLFAIYGFTKNIRKSGCQPCYYIILGLIALAGNSLLLVIANRTGVDQFNLLQLITLKQTSLESSFIVFGYCLIIQGVAMLIRSLFTPTSMKSSRHFY